MIFLIKNLHKKYIHNNFVTILKMNKLQNIENLTASERLIMCGIRPSVQRLAIMDYLMNNHNHPTVDVIYNQLLPSIPTLSRTTVYNTVEALVEHGAASALTIDSRNAHYDARLDPHSHFMCNRCGRIIDMPLHYDVMNDSPEPGSTVESVNIYYRGLCNNCNSRQ